MKKMQRMLAVVLAAMIFGSQQPALVVEASTWQEKLDEILQNKDKNKQEQNAVENKKKEAQDKVDGLKEEAEDLGDTYHSLSNKLDNVSDEIDKTTTEIKNATTDIAKLEEELETAKKNRDAQYEGMKKRIQYMYENGTESMLVSILSSGSIAEFVKRTEYAAMIASYDRKMVESYDNLQKTIEAKTKQIQEKQKQLLAYQETLETKENELNGLVGEAGKAYASKNGEVSAAQMSVEEFNQQIAAYEAQEKAYEAQYAAIQAEMAKEYTQSQGGVVEDTSGALGYSQEDLTLMAAIIQAEAGGESYAGQLAVGTVIMNRVMSAKFPNTLAGVIYQKNQFQPVRNGHLDAILQRGPNESCTNAARETLGGYRSGDWLFFMTQYWADYYGITGYTMIGNHAFFRVWGAN